MLGADSARQISRGDVPLWLARVHISYPRTFPRTKCLFIIRPRREIQIRGRKSVLLRMYIANRSREKRVSKLQNK